MVSFYQLFVPGHMGKHAQLNLGIVRVHKDAAFPRYEHLPNASAQLHAHGDILQIGLCGADASGGGNRLVEAGVNPLIRPDIDRQSVGIGGFQLGQLPVLQDVLDNGRLPGKLFQHICRRGITCLGLLAPGKLHGIKEHLSQLLRRIDVEFHSRLGMDGLLQFLYPLHQRVAVGLQLLPAHLHALALHIVQHQRQGHLHVPHQLIHAGFFQLFLQNLRGGSRHISAITAIFRELLRHKRRGLMKLLFPEDLPPSGYGKPQVLRRNGFQVVIAL